VFSPIQIGHYTVMVSASGFQTTTQKNLTLNLGQRLNIPIKLQPGSVSQSVTVTTAPPLLQTQESSVGQIVTTEQINDTPLNGRNWVFMVQLTPGAVPSNSRAKGSGDFNANGLRAEQNNFILDGMDNKTITVDYLGGSSYLVSPPPDALAEFQVSTADYSAEFGHSAGAVVDASIKAGTNQIHGDIWEYWRNNILDARDFDALTIPEFRQNLFGATLGLPIIKNRLFFFGDVQANRIAAGQPYTQSVPTALERQGNFSELLNPALTGESKPVLLYEPNSGGTKPLACNGQQNVFCQTQIDPVAQKVLSLYPLPNANGGKTFANNVQNLSQPENTFQWDVRVDYNITQKDQAFARFSYNNAMGNYAGPLGPTLDGSCGEGSDCVSGLQVNYGNSFVASETHIFTPTLVNELRFGYDYGHFDTYQLNFNTNIAATLGLGGMPFGPGFKDNGGLPQLGIASIAQAGTHAYRPEEEFENEYQILDNVSETLGRHSLKLGVSLQSIRSYTLEAPSGHGAYDFSGFFTGANGRAFTGNGQADFLADQMDNGQIGPSTPFNDAQWNISGYAQDDWRVSDKLTLNLGLRYDWFEPYKELGRVNT
jgi:outer membrane receptor protein involved in Fe transport